MDQAAKRQWAIELPLPVGSLVPAFEVCRCDSVDSVCAVLAALLRSGGRGPDQVTIRELPTQ